MKQETAARKPATTSDGRAEGAHAQLMREMKSKRGYDPMPPAQHEWQMTEGLPANVVRFWSWLCAHTIRARMVKNQAVRTPYATLDDGVKPATLADFGREAGIGDTGQLSRIHATARLLGICSVDGKTGRIYLNGEVTAAQVIEANKKRNTDCTVSIPPPMLLRIKKLPKHQQARFFEQWQAAQDYCDAVEAAAIAEARKTRSDLEFTLLRTVGEEKKRTARRAPPAPELPPILAEIVQSLTVQSVAADCTVSEDEGETLTVPSDASLCVQRSTYREDLFAASPGNSEGTHPSTSPPLVETEGMMLANLLVISEQTAEELLEKVHAVDPTITWLETACLASRFLKQSPNARNPVGLLLARLHTHAKGATLAAARRETREYADRQRYQTAGSGR